MSYGHAAREMRGEPSLGEAIICHCSPLPHPRSRATRPEDEPQRRFCFALNAGAWWGEHTRRWGRDVPYRTRLSVSLALALLLAQALSLSLSFSLSSLALSHLSLSLSLISLSLSYRLALSLSLSHQRERESEMRESSLLLPCDPSLASLSHLEREDDRRAVLERAPHAPLPVARHRLEAEHDDRGEDQRDERAAEDVRTPRAARVVHEAVHLDRYTIVVCTRHAARAAVIF